MADIIAIKKREQPAVPDILSRLDGLEDVFITGLQEIRAIKLELKKQVDSDATTGSEKLLDAKEVAEYLGESEQWVYRQIKSKKATHKIPAIKLGKYWKVSPSQLQKWIEQKNKVACGT
jgi:excisionase family DNA binding protein